MRTVRMASCLTQKERQPVSNENAARAFGELNGLQRYSAACRAGREKPRAFAGNTYTCLSACATMPCVMAAG